MKSLRADYLTGSPTTPCSNQHRHTTTSCVVFMSPPLALLKIVATGKFSIATNIKDTNNTCHTETKRLVMLSTCLHVFVRKFTWTKLLAYFSHYTFHVFPTTDLFAGRQQWVRMSPASQARRQVVIRDTCPKFTCV